MAGTAGMGQEVGTDGLEGALGGTAELADGLDVLLGSPALREGEERGWYSDGSGHFCGVWFCKSDRLLERSKVDLGWRGTFFLVNFWIFLGRSL